MHVRFLSPTGLGAVARTLALSGALSLGCATAPGWTPAKTPASWQAHPESTYFLQMADTQFGMWSTPRLYLLLGWSGDPDSFERETRNMERAIAHANRLRPDFVIVCGDLTDTPGHAGQIAEFERIAAQLDAGIPLYVVAGNHDVENAPTTESLAAYRKTFGPDYFSFRVKDVFGIVLNSQLIHSPERVPHEADEQRTWLKGELARAKASGAAQVLVFQHHPYFLEVPDEDDQYFNIPSSRHRPYLGLFREAGVRAIFAGHYHRNAHGFDGDLEMITTGPVGMPLGVDPSGFRIVRAGPDGLEHVYYGLDAVPESLGAP
jgi:3',5'-cyclic AMP phosphodiesterase CpdA